MTLLKIIKWLVIILVLLGIFEELYKLFNRQFNKNTSTAQTHSGVLMNTKHYRVSHFVKTQKHIDSKNSKKSKSKKEQSQRLLPKIKYQANQTKKSDNSH
ncbi:hypothetical protein [Bombilactobacillus bombi]|uniref:hypothetical protein n=1 Tax=Bombilactobacillus bombi TaxID=1303590 RepID=UPI0015E5F0E6|nr:hypothetical protein [Bombilactobacillus bombi]MBA1435099.1 hypothetical protein [Bombilactobacillus bombi]